MTDFAIHSLARSTAEIDISIHNCLHCGAEFKNSNSKFCCNACKAVYELLQDRGLKQYYDMHRSSGKMPSTPKTSAAETDFSYIDDAEFIRLYSRPTADHKKRVMEFYLDGVHCAACIWLVEKLPEFLSDADTIRLNLGRSVASVQVAEGGSFGRVAEELTKLGYQPHPVQPNEAIDLQKKENRKLLLRLGVAGACAGNLMILAVSLYGGASGMLAQYFRLLSFFIFLPVLLFSATPFYQSAWSAIRARQSSIDIPVVFGLLIGSAASIYNLFTGYSEIYFDSLSALIFLLLGTRYLLRRLQQSAMGSSHLLQFLTPSTVRRWKPDTQSYMSVRADELKIGDRVRVLAGELIPADATISKGKSFVNYALLTGESNPVAANEKDIVFAGTTNLESPLEIVVTQSGTDSRIAKILKATEDALQNRAQISIFADKISRIFVFIVVILSAGVLLGGFFGNWHDSLNRALALTIVTCPCAFALATPLSFSHILGKLAANGILVKSPEAIERLTQVQNVYFDKTGTLTNGLPELHKWVNTNGNAQENEAAVLALESQSMHPIAIALTNFLKPKVELIPDVSNFREVLGQGVSGMVAGSFYQIYRSNYKDSTIDVFRNNERVSSIRLGEQVRNGANQAIQKLKTMGLTLNILSGDATAATQSIGQELGISADHCIPGCTPEVKAAIIKESPNALMVGDGANDAIAFAAAHASIAVQGSAEIGMRTADVFINRTGIEPVYQLLVIAKETMKVVQRNFSFTIFYNIIAGIAAMLGKIDPLFAALLMPASAMTVFLSATLGTQNMNRAFKELSR